jgi:phosphopantetheinyl transferase (holo-ACP synthase)
METKNNKNCAKRCLTPKRSSKNRHQRFAEKFSAKAAVLTAVTVFALTALVQFITPGGLFSKLGSVFAGGTEIVRD